MTDSGGDVMEIVIGMVMLLDEDYGCSPLRLFSVCPQTKSMG